MPEHVPERRRAAHRRAEELAGVGTWSYQLDSGVLTTNPTARRMLEWPADRPEPELRDFLELVHPQDREHVTWHTDRLVSLGEEYDIEHRALMPGGRLVFLRAVACADRDDTGRVTALHGITMDVTELRLAAEEVERERDRSQAVLSSLHDGYLLVAGGVIVEVNEALCRLTGFAEGELVGVGTPYPFWPPEQVDEVLTQRRGTVAAGGGRHEFEVLRKDGRRRRVAMTATSLPAGDGLPVWFVLLRDVTEQRERERLLETRAATDPLTGVDNSRTFREELRAAVLTAGTAPLALALIDVDHFKQVNDRFGHSVGDEVLVTVVERLVDATEGAGTLARVGGEEFALLMPGLDAAAGHRLVGAALEALRSVPLPRVGTVTASAGVAQLLVDMDDDGLYRLADALLYEAKSRGRDQVR